MWIADAARCREIDRRAIEEYGTPSATLMERAGQAVFAAVSDMAPFGSALSVFCGKGNNGGDGFVVARLALERGFHPRCLVAAAEPELSPDSAARLSEFRALGGAVSFFGEAGWHQALEAASQGAVVVDALLGTGVSGEPRGPVRACIEQIRALDLPVVSVDVPSGIDTDTGAALGACVLADRTITFGLPKPCFFQGEGATAAGFWMVDDIGLPHELLRQSTGAFLTEPVWAPDAMPQRLTGCHKGDNGHVLILAGSARMPGAAVLAAWGALRAGAGLVTVAGIESVCRNVARHLPEALLLPLPESGGVVSSVAAGTLLERASSFDAAVAGPGLTHEPPVRALLQSLWPQWHLRTVLDADALNVLAASRALPAGECVLTPHPGEMGRLLGSTAREVQAARFASAREAVERYGKTVLLKGAFTVVATPGLPLSVNPTGNPGMATGGMGDVLSGVIGTLLAQGMPVHEAATLGAFWHGAAGDLCAEEIGPTGFTARELANRLPRAQARMLDQKG